VAARRGGPPLQEEKTMKARAFVLVLALTVVSAAWAQEANDGIHVDVSTSYTKLANGPARGTSATVITARIPASDRWALVYNQFQIPAANAQIYLGGVEYREVLSHIIKAKSTLPLDKIQVYLRAGAGTRRDSLGDRASFAGGFLGGISAPVGSIAGAKLAFQFEVGWIGGARLRRPGQSNFFLNNAPAIAPGLTLRW
jgi:hypothetical protein